MSTESPRSQPIETEKVVEQLRRITSSGTFQPSARRKRVLKFLVTETLAGRANELKDVVIAQKYYAGNERGMRADAGRIRQQLAKYYRLEGKLDPIIIEVPTGRYVPEFSSSAFDVTNITNEVPNDKSVNDQPANAKESAEEWSAPDMRARVYRYFVDVTFALEEQRFEHVVKATDKFFLMLDESLLHAAEEKIPAKIKIMRLLALMILKRRDQAMEEAATVDLNEFEDDLAWAPYALCFLLFVYERTENTKLIAELRSKMWKLLDTPESCLGAAKRTVGVAKGLAADELYCPALALLEGVVDRVRQNANCQIRAIYAEARYLSVHYLLQLKRHAEVLEIHRQMEQEFEGQSEENLIWPLASAGLEAARALRAINRYQDADALANSLNQRFGGVKEKLTRRAVAWALIERSNTCASTGDNDGAVDVCSHFIQGWSYSDAEPSLEWVLAWAYFQKSFCLQKGKRYAEAIAICDEMVERFGNSTSIDIQAELASALVQKIVALRRSKRLAASIAAAKSLSVRLADATDPRIIVERVWAIHSEGDVRLCEAKLLRQAGLHEDAELKLREASQYFAEAAERLPNEPWHFRCRSYAEFLLGQTADAEQTLMKALRLHEGIDWLEGWIEFRMFPIPEDSGFLAAVKRWRGASDTMPGGHSIPN